MKTFKMFNLPFLFTLGIFAIIFGACEKNNLKIVEPPIENPQTLEDRIINIFQPMVDGDTTISVSVGIFNKGEKEQFFFGEKERGSGQKPDENTLYEIGSITKTMTATLLADMVLRGEVKLDDPVENYLPAITDFPDFKGEKITFQHLANHTSALPNIPDNFLSEDFNEKNPFAHYTASMLYDFLDGYELPYALGTKEEYSNLAMGLLGHTLGLIRGSTFDQELEDLFTHSIGLGDTYLQLSDQTNNYAQPYDEDFEAVPMWDMSEPTLGAGGVKSSLADMMLYLEANLGHLQTPVEEAMELTHQTTQSLNHPFISGLAWQKIISAVDGSELIWHNGGTGGTVAFIGFVKKFDVGVVLLFNTEINERSRSQNLLELLKGIEVINTVKEE